MSDFNKWRLCVAPMMDWTDTLCRQFHRTLTRRARLYTEMVTAAAIIHGPRHRLLSFAKAEHPLALQIGGADPRSLGIAARLGEEAGYDEINLNVGCPSDRVQGGRFGACLMREPQLVGDCVSAMKASVSIPVTVKCRLGVDDQDDGALDRIADETVAAGVDALIVHARKAWLKGLSPKQNREVPPLDYSRVHHLKTRLPSVPIIINGGIADITEAKAQLTHVDGVMLGRAAYQTPAMLIDIDPKLFGVSAPVTDACDAARAMRPLLARMECDGVAAHRLTRHMLGLFHGVAGARAFRQRLTPENGRPSYGPDGLDHALAAINIVDPNMSTDRAA